MNEQSSLPKGDLVVRTIAMPADANWNGDIFGGWLLSQMDIGGAIAARKISKTRITTIAINSMVFKYPVSIGDTLCCYAELIKKGRTSLQFNINAWVVPAGYNGRVCVTEALFTYVTIDGQGKPIKIIVDKETI